MNLAWRCEPPVIRKKGGPVDLPFSLQPNGTGTTKMTKVMVDCSIM